MYMRRVRLAALLAAPAIGGTYALAQPKAQAWPAMLTPTVGVPATRCSSGDTDAILNYQKPHVSAVSSRRDLEGSDDSLHGADWDYRHVVIRNGRKLERAPTLDKAGFELVEDRLDHVDYYCEESVTSTYYQQCEELMTKVTGARFVRAFDHNIRSASGQAAGKKLRGGNAVQGPAGIVHGDYTADSAPRRFKLLGQPPKLNDALKKKLGEQPLVDSETIEEALTGKRRYALINVWRPIKPVACKPLACADASTVVGDELIVFSIHYADRVGENYFAKWPRSGEHAWSFFPEMTPDGEWP